MQLQKLCERVIEICQADRVGTSVATPADNDYSPEALAKRMERIEASLAALQVSSRGTRKAVWGTWFYSVSVWQSTGLPLSVQIFHC